MASPKRIGIVPGARYLVKCISSLFPGSNCIPRVTAHLIQIAAASSRARRFFSSVFPITRGLVSSIKPITIIPGISASTVYKLAIYRMNKISESKDLYRTTTLIEIGVNTSLSK